MFKFKNAFFLTSVVSKEQWLKDNKKEFCFIGKSNVGKSTFINFLTNNKKLAKISSTPGKTRMLNYFSINNDEFRLVDAPGYGFAKINNKEKIKFSNMMDEYLKNRKNLVFVALLLDLRRIPNNNDIEMFKFLKFYNIKTIIIGTKLDKLKKNDINKNIKIIKNKLEFNDNYHFILVSSLKKIGRDECWNLFYNLLNDQ